MLQIKENVLFKKIIQMLFNTDVVFPRSVSADQIHQNKTSSHKNSKTSPKSKSPFQLRKEFDNERRRIDDERQQKFEKRREKDAADSLQPNLYSNHGHSTSRSTTPSSSIYDSTDLSSRRGMIK